MRFAEAWALWFLLGVPIVGAGLALAAWRRRILFSRFAGGAVPAARLRSDVSPHVRAVKGALALAALAGGIVAFARPQWGVGLDPVTRTGVDVVIAIDTSASMLAQDAPPDRLGLARHAAARLVESLEGDRVALVTFAGGAAIACPLTLDQDAVRVFLDGVDAEAVSVPGTALAEAMRAAVRAFAPEGRQARGKVVVILSDGEDHEGGLEEAIGVLKEAGVVAHALGCGSARGAPIPEGGGSEGFKKDREGRTVTTRLDESTLSGLAIATGGRYVRATPASKEVEEIAKTIASLEGREAGSVMRTRYVDRFQIPLALALVALVGETLVADRARRRRES